MNIDTFIIPSPFILHKKLKKDFDHSYVWMEEGEIMGYMMVYSDLQQKKFLIYKLVTSPFGRGRGIGTTFIEHLSGVIPQESMIYVYVWEKQMDTLEFFQKKGFLPGENIVYRNLVYHYLFAEKTQILRREAQKSSMSKPLEDIGKTRHDARKTLKLLSHMVEMLSPENGDKIIEDINRETTSLINTLNSFRDTMQIIHTVNLKELIIERIIPYIEASSVDCELNLKFKMKNAIVPGFYVNMGRAMINIISNALDAIKEKGCPGKIWITLWGKEGKIFLEIKDNGSGIAPEKLQLNSSGLPIFVGKTSKTRGEGLGTQQIFNTFGKDDLEIKSNLGVFTHWTISFEEVILGQDKRTRQLERLYHEFFDLLEDFHVSTDSKRTEVIASIWQLRKMEIFMYDLIFLFSKYNNIRLIFRGILSYLQGGIDDETLEEQIDSYQVDQPQTTMWLFTTAKEIRRRMEMMQNNLDLDKFRGALFKSYGQSYNNVIIFTLDPETGDFLASDRKLAEHLDFAPFLGKEKDKLLRGEFIGDMNNHDKPISFGVWSIESQEDLINKLKMIRRGAKRLLEIGIHPMKRMAFYQTTYINHNQDIDTYSSSTFGEFSKLSDEELERFVRPADDEFSNFLAAMD
jgi:N-acetylglutamate synthase-like GNAT family acetyltransferase